jgi:hypothetical protein
MSDMGLPDVRVQVRGPARDRAALRDWLRAACRDTGGWPPPVFGILTTRKLLSFGLEPMHQSFHTPLMTRLTRRYPRLVHSLTWTIQMTRRAMPKRCLRHGRLVVCTGAGRLQLYWG